MAARRAVAENVIFWPTYGTSYACTNSVGLAPPQTGLQPLQAEAPPAPHSAAVTLGTVAHIGVHAAASKPLAAPRGHEI